ncbi:hypothetical protein KL953_35580, partial [Mycolicibacterium goodii]|uniref:hypothetical protein n=1 Tax=Mycolicibacterium goodii TaxID=134601 RepID=UPI001BDD537B
MMRAATSLGLELRVSGPPRPAGSWPMAVLADARRVRADPANELGRDDKELKALSPGIPPPPPPPVGMPPPPKLGIPIPPIIPRPPPPIAADA